MAASRESQAAGGSLNPVRALCAGSLNRALSVSQADGYWASLSGRPAPVAGIGLQACRSARTCGGANAA